MSGDDGAYRKLSELVATERARVIREIHSEAESEGWHQLSPAKKARLYRLWEARYRLSHATVKDGIMKGFDVAQGIPASGEAAIHATLLSVLLASSIPYVRSKERRPEWRREVDFVLGFSDRFLTHIVELEAAPSWQAGLQQCLLYKSLYFQATKIQALPTLMLFGNASRARWEQISTVCLDQRVLLLAYQLEIDGVQAPDQIAFLLESSPGQLSL